MRKKWLKGISRLSVSHPRKVLIVSMLVFGLAFLLTGRLRFDPDFLALFPAEKGPMKLYIESLKEAKTFDLLFVLLERREEVDLPLLIESGKEIAQALKRVEIHGKKAFRRIQFQRIEMEDLEETKSLLALFLSRPYLFLDEEEIPYLKEKWRGEEIAKQVLKNKNLLLSHASFGMKDFVEIDPFELRWLWWEKWKAGIRGMDFDPSSPFFLSRDGRFLLILAEPIEPATNPPFSRELMKRLNELTLSIEKKGIQVFLTGAHPIATSEARALRLDMQSSFLLSLLLVLLLFFYTYRRWIVLLFVGLPLFGGIQLTMGLASVTIGRLNLLTSAFAAILVGLGIDFAVHLYDRYQQERANQKEIPMAIEIALTQTGDAILSGAFTTIFAFGVLYFSRIRGIMELAFLVSVGLLFALLCIFLVLPSFLVWIEQRKTLSPSSSPAPFQLSFLSSALKKGPSKFIWIAVGITILSLFSASQLKIETDLRSLRPKEIQPLTVLEKMGRAFGGRKVEAAAIQEGRDLSSLLLKEEEMVKAFEKNKKEGKMNSSISISPVSRFLPSIEKQKRIAHEIRKAIHLDEVKRHLIKALNENGFFLPSFHETLAALEELRLGKEKLFPPETLFLLLQKSPLGRGIEPRIAQKGEHFKLITPIYYPRGSLSFEELERQFPEVSFTGPERIETEMLKIVKEDLFLLTPFAFLLIFLLVFSHFKRPTLTLLTLLPLAIGLLWMMGAMAILGIHINFVNAVILPMIIGMGIDNSIHLLHRYLEEGGRDPIEALQKTARPMTLCSLTTMLGFGSLVTTRYQALSTMGWVTILGMGFCLINSMVLLPAIVLLVEKRKK